MDAMRSRPVDDGVFTVTMDRRALWTAELR